VFFNNGYSGNFLVLSFFNFKKKGRLTMLSVKFGSSHIYTTPDVKAFIVKNDRNCNFLEFHIDKYYLNNPQSPTTLSDNEINSQPFFPLFQYKKKKGRSFSQFNFEEKFTLFLLQCVPIIQSNQTHFETQQAWIRAVNQLMASLPTGTARDHYSRFVGITGSRDERYYIAVNNNSTLSKLPYGLNRYLSEGR